MVRSSAVHKLAGLGEVYRKTFLKRTCDAFPERHRTWVSAVGFLLSGYLFERQGRSPEYAPLACQALREVAGQSPAPTPTPELSARLWERFCELGGWPNGRGANAGNCPLNPARGLDVIAECARLVEDDFNPIVFIERQFRSDDVRRAHDALKRVRGVERKIASFVLRDVALAMSDPPAHSSESELLQPIDLWLRRTLGILDRNLASRAAEAALASAAVRIADAEGVSPLLFNAGAWYFASQIARTRSSLSQALVSPSSLEEAARRHAEWLSAGARAILDGLG